MDGRLATEPGPEGAGTMPVTGGKSHFWLKKAKSSCHGGFAFFLLAQGLEREGVA